MTSIAAVLAQALQLQQQGRLAYAEQLFRQVLDIDPTNAPAMHHLGLLAHLQGEHARALEYLLQALALAPREASYHYNLGVVYGNLRHGEKAEDCYRRALELQPDYGDAALNLGNLHLASRQWEAASTSYQKALQLRPHDPKAWNGLGYVCWKRGQLAEAVQHFRQAVALRSDFAEAYHNLGIVYREQGLLDDAVASCRQALALRPDFAEAHDSLGTALLERGALDEAVASFRQALALQPHFVGALNNLGIALRAKGLPDEALVCFQQAVQLRPDFFQAQNNLAAAFKYQGLMDQAVAGYRRALELHPEDRVVHGKLVYYMQYCPAYDTRAICDELRRWNDRHAARLAPSLSAHENPAVPQRRLRIGYVSPHLRMHPVGRFMVPLLEKHNHGAFEIFAYACHPSADVITERCKAHCDVWREVAALNDQQLAEQIRQDRIDILVDLAMFTEGGRLLTFARKPAPVQVTYLAYPGSSGLAVMDYRLSDPYLDPPGDPDERLYAEQTIRLPETYWCYRPPIETPSPGPLPATRNGRITFGCLNNFGKVSEPTLRAWAHLLQLLPEARLWMHATAGGHRERLYQLLGVSPERLRLIDGLSLEDYFAVYQEIDVALDTFPHGGGTTTCDALWMGVPVISLAGRTAVSRGGLSILSNLGLRELVAENPHDYVRRALELASDLPRLGQLRSGLRQRMLASPLMDANRFATSVEAAYRMMWHNWCKASSS